MQAPWSSLAQPALAFWREYGRTRDRVRVSDVRAIIYPGQMRASQPMLRLDHETPRSLAARLPPGWVGFPRFRLRTPGDVQACGDMLLVGPNNTLLALAAAAQLPHTLAALQELTELLAQERLAVRSHAMAYDASLTPQRLHELTKAMQPGPGPTAQLLRSLHTRWMHDRSHALALSDMPRQPGLAHIALSDGQLRVLDLAPSHRQLLALGPMGSGTNLLGYELARLALASGLTPLIICAHEHTRRALLAAQPTQGPRYEVVLADEFTFVDGPQHDTRILLEVEAFHALQLAALASLGLARVWALGTHLPPPPAAPATAHVWVSFRRISLSAPRTLAVPNARSLPPAWLRQLPQTQATRDHVRDELGRLFQQGARPHEIAVISLADETLPLAGAPRLDLIPLARAAAPSAHVVADTLACLPPTFQRSHVIVVDVPSPRHPTDAERLELALGHATVSATVLTPHGAS